MFLVAFTLLYKSTLYFKVNEKFEIRNRKQAIYLEWGRWVLN